MTSMTEPESDIDTTIARPSYLNLGKVWVLSNFLSDNSLCNLVIDRMLEKLSRFLTHKVSSVSLSWIYDRTHSASKLRLLLTDVMISRIDEGTFTREAKGYPQELMFEFARKYAMGRSRQLPGPTFADRCSYHDHDEGEARCT